MTTVSTSLSKIGFLDIRNATDAQLREWLGEASDAELSGQACSMIRIELNVRDRERMRHKGTACE